MTSQAHAGSVVPQFGGWTDSGISSSTPGNGSAEPQTFSVIFERIKDKRQQEKSGSRDAADILQCPSNDLAAPSPAHRALHPSPSPAAGPGRDGGAPAVSPFTQFGVWTDSGVSSSTAGSGSTEPQTFTVIFERLKDKRQHEKSGAQDAADLFQSVQFQFPSQDTAPPAPMHRSPSPAGSPFSRAFIAGAPSSPASQSTCSTSSRSPARETPFSASEHEEPRGKQDGRRGELEARCQHTSQERFVKGLRKLCCVAHQGVLSLGHQMRAKNRVF